MANLIKMDMRRMLHAPMFYITLIIVSAFNILLNFALVSVAKLFMSSQAVKPTTFSDIITTPFFIPLLIILMFASVIAFFYADISGGFIKNIAGQLPRKSYLIVSKFIVGSIHNLIFMVAGVLSYLLGCLGLSAMGMITLTDDGNILAAVMTLLLKWLLSVAITSILLFVSNGIQNKVLASVIGVIIGTGSLGLAYMGLNTAIDGIFHSENFDIGSFMPDTLLGNVNVAANTAVLNALIVSLVCIAVFLALTVKVFNSRDVK